MPDPLARQHRNWAQWFGNEWHAIRAATAARVEPAIEDWCLSDQEPFGNGGVGYVYPVRRHGGELGVLKVEPAHDGLGAAGSRPALVVWSRSALTPTVLASRDVGRTLLLRLVVPGTELGSHTSAIEESFPVIAGMARRLRVVPRTCVDGPFPTISQFRRLGGLARRAGPSSARRDGGP